MVKERWYRSTKFGFRPQKTSVFTIKTNYEISHVRPSYYVKTEVLSSCFFLANRDNINLEAKHHSSDRIVRKRFQMAMRTMEI